MKKKVLMLGWEFPPVINGGLGVACLGLSKALSEFVELTVILPKSDPHFIVENVELIGLNNIDLKKILKASKESFTTQYDTFAETSYVDIDIDPYLHISETIGQETNRHTESTTKSTTIADVETEDLMIEKFLHVFRDGELYGQDVIQKVIYYSKYVLRLAAEKDFDIIYAHDWMTFLAGLELKARMNKPLVLHVHALDYDRGGPESKGWIFDLEKYAMENADLILPVSEYTASVIANHYHIDPAKITPVHNGADEVNVYKVEKGFPEKLVLFLGRVTGQKGPEFFLEVASKVYENYPKVRFVVAGTGDRLKRMIESGAYKEIGHKFHFTGFLDKEKVHHLLAMTDVYCMPSVSEPFGLSALEAAQFGIPMVISKQSGVAEVLSGALSADYWDTDLMADHILALLKSKRLANQVVKMSNNDLKNLSWKDAAKKVNSAFDTLLESKTVK